ncbi:MAG: SDR family NAD(P)-dependent oxidoreductase, partial [Betaproteobacteria bacterium]|nr:SDR family NAD(P)-dependent oxidoreductase [Betaproteobacteria bacterium]
MTHQNQRVLITAAASGIGLVMADAFVAAGARVYICDADAAALDNALQTRPHVRGMLCDVAQESQVRELFAQAT